MATRFGAATPAHTYAARVRWLVGCLIAVILILVVTLVFVARGASKSEAAVDHGAQAASTNQGPLNPTVDILVAQQRIEAGESLQTFMFVERPVRQDSIPEGALLAREKNSIVGKFAKNMINANLPLLKQDVSEQKPLSAVTSNIPPGYRAVTITVDNRSGVEGWAQPNTRVDVLWTYTAESNRKKVATIVRFCKILSVGGMASGAAKSDSKSKNGQTTVTLLVTEQDAKRIELARQTGSLSLSLIGETDTPKVGIAPEPIDIYDLVPKARAPEAPSEPVSDGVMYTTDPVTGKQVKFFLNGSRWKKDGNF